MQMFLDGAGRDSLSGSTLPVYNPATGTVIDTVPPVTRTMSQQQLQQQKPPRQRGLGSVRRINPAS